MLREQAIGAMNQVFEEIPYGIEHTLRVLANADEIMAVEGIDEPTREIVTLAAILHDIGAVEALHKYGSLEGRFQELEGPAVARGILERLDAEEQVTERVVFIVGHHHTKGAIDGVDFQILWEADVLDGLEFGPRDNDEVELRDTIAENFLTGGGNRLALSRLSPQRPETAVNLENH